MSAPMAGKVIVVTGGAAGIGRATAVALARQGRKAFVEKRKALFTGR